MIRLPIARQFLVALPGIVVVWCRIGTVRVVLPVPAIFIIAIIGAIGLRLGLKNSQQQRRSEESQQSHLLPFDCYTGRIGPNSMAALWQLY
jgi:hypothetical protein